MQTRHTSTAAILAAMIALLTACGGGSDSTPPSAIATIKVVGSDWADSGSLGYKLTVQADNLAGKDSILVWPEWVADGYKQTLCPRYLFETETGFSIKTQQECFNYATAGAKLNPDLWQDTPLNLPPIHSIHWQLEQAALAGYGHSDLLLISTGFHDASELFLTLVNKMSSGPGTPVEYWSIQHHAELVARVLGQHVADEIRRNPDDRQQTVEPYMVALAQQFARTIREQALEKGAQRVMVLNMPDVTLMPYLQWQLGELEPFARRWIDAFNTTLAATLAEDSRVVVVDWHTAFTHWMEHPAQYSLTNVTTPFCPISGGSHGSRPLYRLEYCTVAAISAHPPIDQIANGPNWWKGYAFADNNNHFSPRVHELLGDLVLDALTQIGWR